MNWNFNMFYKQLDVPCGLKYVIHKEMMMTGPVLLQ